MNDTTWHIISYPRSGNHLVRTIAEYTSGRPTLGCPNSKSDTPIYQKKPNKKSNLIQITNSRPIGLKSHFIHEILKHQRAHDPKNILLILRKPADAISSHCARILASKTIPTKGFKQDLIDKQISNYLSLVFSYKAMSAQEKSVVKFEALTGEQAIETVARLSNLFATQPASISDLTWKELQICAKESQYSLPKKLERLRLEISTEIDERLPYEYIDEILNSN